VFSNDPETPSLLLILKGEVTQDLEAIPSSVMFGEVPMGQPATKNVELKIAEPDKVHIKSVTCEDSRFSIKLSSGKDPGNAALEVTFLSGKKQETVTATAKVLLDGTGVSDVEIPISALVVGNLKYPKQFTLIKSNDVFNTRDITIANRQGKPFKIKKVQDKDNRVKLDYPKTAGNEIRLTASVKDPQMSLNASTRGTIQLQTTDPLDSTIEIAYTIFQRKNPSDMRSRRQGAKQDKQPQPNK
jgi:hypothetical protein